MLPYSERVEMVRELVAAGASLAAIAEAVGISTAGGVWKLCKREGIEHGRRRSLDAETKTRAVELLSDPMNSVSEVARQLGIAKSWA